MARFKPGQSGNPRGRPPGAGETGRLREAIAQHLPGIIETMARQALAGDAQAARLLLERALPALRPQELAQAVELTGGTLTQQARDVLSLLAGGELGPQQAAQLLGALSGLARVVEVDELAARVAQLENKR